MAYLGQQQETGVQEVRGGSDQTHHSGLIPGRTELIDALHDHILLWGAWVVGQEEKQEAMRK